ncbi:MAG: hypothetical protein GEU80_11885 [Dehalococcoidia bacterium]|nr:hypothetical protein [Dehalococcoidia bacterium]
MGRAIRSGSRVRLIVAERPRFGEVWAFCTEDGRVVVHRCIARRSGRYRFHGDTSGPDAPVPLDRLIGRAIEVEDRGGEVRTLRFASGAATAARLRTLDDARRAVRALPSPARNAVRWVLRRPRRT